LLELDAEGLITTRTQTKVYPNDVPVETLRSGTGLQSKKEDEAYHADANSDKSKLIIGSWKDGNSKMEYFRDGTFMLHTATGEYKKKAGKWNINGDILTLRYYIHPKPYKYKILELSASTYKVIGVSVDKNTYNARRIEPTKQSPSENNIDVAEAKSQQTSVYAASNSRVYHKRNCSELNTDDLMEFTSSQKAREAGGIPCEHCNPSTVVEEGTSKSAKQRDKTSKPRHTYEWVGWKSLFKGTVFEDKERNENNENNQEKQLNTSKKIQAKNLERQEEISKQVKKLVQSFSIKGVKIGMTIQQVKKLFPNARDGFEHVPLYDRYYKGTATWIENPRLSKKMENNSFLQVDFIRPGAYTEVPIVYKVRFEKHFSSHIKLNVILDKLKTAYGKWSDTHEYNDRYFVIWGAKYAKNSKNKTLFHCREDLFRYGLHVIGGKLYFRAAFSPDISNSFNNDKSALYLQLHSYNIQEDALAAERARIKQQHKKEDDLEGFKLR